MFVKIQIQYINGSDIVPNIHGQMNEQWTSAETSTVVFVPTSPVPSNESASSVSCSTARIASLSGARLVFFATAAADASADEDEEDDDEDDDDEAAAASCISALPLSSPFRPPVRACRSAFCCCTRALPYLLPPVAPAADDAEADDAEAELEEPVAAAAFASRSASERCPHLLTGVNVKVCLF